MGYKFYNWPEKLNLYGRNNYNTSKPTPFSLMIVFETDDPFFFPNKKR